MKVLVDANVLLRLVQPSSPQHADAVSAIVLLRQSDGDLYLVPQVLYEYWVVATRPIAVNGLGLVPSDVDKLLFELLDRFTLLKDERGVFTRWHELVATHSIQGKLAHDARIAAAMFRHGLPNLLTFNKPDFERFTGIEVFTPAQILAGEMPK
jgi:predicted nucleic acid-binding protein